jgi:hypothetical protein
MRRKGKAGSEFEGKKGSGVGYDTPLFALPSSLISCTLHSWLHPPWIYDNLIIEIRG